MIDIDNTDVNKVEKFRLDQKTAVLAIMFVDTHHSTERRAQIGEVKYEKLRRSFATELRRIIADAGNSEFIKDTGDGVLAVFSEPDNCVKCALGIQRKCTTPESQFRVRIGLDLGQVSTEGSGVRKDIFGQQVNRAARLEQLGKDGHILTSMPLWDSAYLWLKHIPTVHWCSHGEYIIRGIEDPQSVFEVFEEQIMKPLQSLRGTKSPSSKSRVGNSASGSSKLSFQALVASFGYRLTEMGGYPGALEDTAAANARAKREETIKQLRAFLAQKFGYESVVQIVQTRPTRLEYPDGVIECDYGRIRGWGEQVDHSIDTRITVKSDGDVRILNEIISLQIEAIRAYKRLAFEASPAISVEKVFEASRAAQRKIESLSDTEITVQVRDYCIDFKTTLGEEVNRHFSRVEIYMAKGGALPNDLHTSIECSQVFDWVLGGVSS